MDAASPGICLKLPVSITFQADVLALTRSSYRISAREAGVRGLFRFSEIC